MQQQQIEEYRGRLDELLARIEGTATSLEEEARVGTGDPEGGNLSKTPMHLADLGSETYLQQLNATLLENEVHLSREIRDALERVRRGTYGTCEGCGQEIPAGRLDALPYARYCTSCAARLGSGLDVNFNEGRPDWAGPFGNTDRHAAGTAGGGTAVGGLAGTNVGHGDPDNADLEQAMGSGQFDADIEENRDDEEGFAGQAGGAVGGTPAGKRASGGRTGGGINPRPGKGDSATGQ
jgi:RNA polymerase-binding transcription factor DksA